jgi:hypothetical protein
VLIPCSTALFFASAHSGKTQSCKHSLALRQAQVKGAAQTAATSNMCIGEKSLIYIR